MANIKRCWAAVVAILCLFAYIGSNAMHSGTFYQKISDDKDNEENTPTSMSSSFTKHFHQCSLQNVCNYVAVNTEDNNLHKVENMDNLKSIGKKLQIWQKVKDVATNKESKVNKVASSCKEAMENGQKENGTAELVIGGSVIPVYCDMVTDGGGWIVFQKRTNSSVNFTRNWKDYEKGFGNLQRNFWLGLEAVHNITTHGNYTLRIDLQNAVDQRGYAKYSNFKIGTKEEKYKITFDKYSGNIGDALRVAYGMPFATYDQDNEIYCAIQLSGGWWYDNTYCSDSVLNNLYPGTTETNISDPNANYANLMTWSLWNGNVGDITFSEIKMKDCDSSGC